MTFFKLSDENFLNNQMVVSGPKVLIWIRFATLQLGYFLTGISHGRNRFGLVWYCGYTVTG